MKNKLLFLALSLLLVSQLFSQDALSQTPVVRVTPTSILSPAVGQTFKVEVAIENGQNIAGYQVMLEYDLAALQLVSYTREGNYLPAGAFYGRAQTKPIKWSPPGSIIQFTKKRLQFAATSSPNESQKTGGTLVTFTFKLLSDNAELIFVPGTSSDKTGTLLANQNGTLTFPRLVNWTGFGTTLSDSVDSTTPLHDYTDVALSHGGEVRCVAYSPWGVVLASGGTDDTMRLWRGSTGEHLNTYEHGGDVNSVAFTPNDTYIASGSDDGKLRLYKWSAAADTWVSSQTFNVPGGALTNNVKSVAFSHDNTMLACGTSGNSVLLWDYDSAEAKWVYRETLKGHTGSVNSVTFSPSNIVLASASDDNTVRLWRAHTGEHLNTLEEHTADVNSVAFSRNDAFLASGSDDDTVILWQWSASADTWVFHKSLDEPDDDVRSVVFNPSGTVLLGGIADSTIAVWDGKTGDYQAFLKEHTGAVNSVAYNFQGNALASGSDDGTVRQLPYTESTDIVDSGMSLTLPPNLISEVAFGPNSTYFILQAQFPTLTGFQDEPSYGKCTITLDLEGVPEDPVGITDRGNPRLDAPGYFMYPLKSPRRQIADATNELAVESGVDIVSAGADQSIPGAGVIISLSWNLGRYIGEFSHIFQSTADPVFVLDPSNFGEGTGRPTGAMAFLFLVQKQLKNIEIKIEQAYVLKSERRQFWFDPIRTVTYKRTFPLTNGTLAAPSAQPVSLADYPPFQELPLEVQEFLRRHFAELMNIGDWQIPEETSLLPNYPNPFNPETWIPYQLAEPAEVTLTLYDISGRVVRNLDLGHQHAGVYHSRSRAAYWDGRNAQGEPVASGVYFYTLKAGDFAATRKMLIRK